MESDYPNVNITTLQNLYSEILKIDFNGKSKYYHLKTIRNLINFFDGIKDEKARIEVYNLITEYLTLIREADDLSDIDTQSSKEWFDQYIRRIIKHYEPALGFMPYGKFYTYSFWFIVISAGIWLVSRSIILIIIFAAIFYGNYIWMLVQKRKGKVYGFLY
jgi:hypothetical protein